MKIIAYFRKNIINYHLLYTIILRVWGLAAGALTIILIPFCLTEIEQGYYYAFASILALQIFFELGLNQVIVQLVSNESAHLKFEQDGEIIGDIKRAGKLINLVILIRRWYTFVSLAFFLVSSLSGLYFFGYKNNGLSISQWCPPWIFVVALTSVNLLLSPRLAVIEGTGQVGDVARLRFYQSIIGSTILWMLLLNGVGLWSVIAIPFTSAVLTYFWLLRKKKWFLSLSSNAVLSWQRDILPLQWRISVSWMCGYFIFNLFVPLVFSIHGAVEAGRLGISITIFNSIMGLGLSFISSKAPNFTMHISRKEYKEVNKLFIFSTTMAVLSTFLIICFGALVLLFMEYYKFNLVNRISDKYTLLWIGLGVILNTFIAASATYMRAYLKEPMLLPSVVGAVITSIVLFATYDNIMKMMMANTIVIAVIGLPWTILLLRNFMHQNK
jgi:hypothetical protein